MAPLDRYQLSMLANLMRARTDALRAFVTAGRLLPDADYETSDAMQTIRDKSFAELSALLTRMNFTKAAEELREVEAALERLRDGEYGACSTCGERISYARLQVMPEAKRCALCQAKAADRRDADPMLSQ